jgi:hypothetical protein
VVSGLSDQLTFLALGKVIVVLDGNGPRVLFGNLGYIAGLEIRARRIVHRDQWAIAEFDLEIVNLAGVATVNQVYIWN